MSDIKSKMHQIQFRLPQLDPAGGAYSAPPDPLAGFNGPTSKGRGGQGRETWRGQGRGRGGEGGEEERGEMRGQGRGEGREGRRNGRGPPLLTPPHTFPHLPRSLLLQYMA